MIICLKANLPDGLLWRRSFLVQLVQENAEQIARSFVRHPYEQGDFEVLLCSDASHVVFDGLGAFVQGLERDGDSSMIISTHSILYSYISS